MTRHCVWLSVCLSVCVEQHSLLWNTPGVMAVLVQEIQIVYPLLSPPKLRNHHNQRICNALVLLQAVASNEETQIPLVDSDIPLMLFPFLHTVSRPRPFEYLRVVSLGVLGALVKSANPKIINKFRNTELLELCLDIVKTTTEISAVVATFIIECILKDAHSFDEICKDDALFAEIAETTIKLFVMPEVKVRETKHALRCLELLSKSQRHRAELVEQLQLAPQGVPLLLTLQELVHEDTQMQQHFDAICTNLSMRASPPAMMQYMDPHMLQYPQQMVMQPAPPQPPAPQPAPQFHIPDAPYVPQRSHRAY